MKTFITVAALVFSFFSSAQIPVTAVITTNAGTATGTSYTNVAGDTTYNWAVNPNNNTQLLTGFTAGGLDYGFTPGFTGTVKLRRVNNVVTGNFTLIWAEFIQAGTNVFNMLPAYVNDMEPFFNNHIYNQGTDNFFDNVSLNSNNIERLDWTLLSGFATPVPGKIGFAVFDRGPTAAHDPFCIAAITSLDGSGNPASYGPVVRVIPANFGDPAFSNITYKIVKGSAGTNLLESGGNTQGRGGTFVSLQSLGIAANTTMYGYSLFSNDLPVSATPADLVDYTNGTNFPVNTTTAMGGIDLIAVTGIFIDLTILPVYFTSFDAVENNNIITLKWKVENAAAVHKYGIERSTDGIHYFEINTVNANGAGRYAVKDTVSSLPARQLYYRIKQYGNNATVYFSKVLTITRSTMPAAINIYPNPVTDNLSVNITAATNDKAAIIVHNAMGAQVIVQQVQLNNGNNFYSVNGIDRLAKGIYQLSFIPESGKTVTKQFIKQ